MIKGQSFTIGIIFDAGYDKERIQSLELNIGEKIVGRLSDNTIFLEDDIYICRLTSQQTSFLPSGNIPVTVHLQDSILGVRKPVVGTLEISTSKSKTTSEKSNELVDYFIHLSIDDEQITTNVTLQTLYKGNPGITPHIGGNGNWWIGDTDTGVQAEGEQGEPGPQGIPGNMFQGQYNLVIKKQDTAWVDGFLWINTGSKTAQQIVEVGHLSISTGTGTIRLNPEVHYPSGSTYLTSSVPDGFYVRDSDGRLSQDVDFEFVDIRFNLKSDLGNYKYDGLFPLEGPNVAFDDYSVGHSGAMRDIFLAIYPDFTGEVYRSATDELCNFSRIDMHFEAAYSRIRRLNLIGVPIVGAAEIEQRGSNPDILKVAAHYGNTYNEVNITPNPHTLTNGVIAITSGPDVENRTIGCTFGNGVEFIEDTVKTGQEYPAYNPYAYSPLYQQSATTAIVLAKLRMIKDATGVSWDIIRRACRATARKTVGGVYSAGFPWDKYRGFGIIHVDGAIQWIKDNYTENQNYLKTFAGKTRYKELGNNSVLEMCMLADGLYSWVVIKENV